MTSDDGAPGAGGSAEELPAVRVSGIARRVLPWTGAVTGTAMLVLLVLPRSALGGALLSLGVAAGSIVLFHDLLDGRVSAAVRRVVLGLVSAFALVLLVRPLTLPAVMA